MNDVSFNVTLGPGIKAAVLLRYKRVGADLSTGSCFLVANGHTKHLQDFASLEYIDLLKLLACYLGQFPESIAIFQKLDRPDIQPMLLSQEESDLFRSDPAQAIKKYIVPPVTIHVREPKQRPDSVIVAGYDVLAEAFGDNVYIRLGRRDATDQYQAECPFCGTWAVVLSRVGASFVLLCNTCGACTEIVDFQPEEQWAGITTVSLLQQGDAESSFFLPRRWNHYKNWISYNDLADMYQRFRKEKEHKS